MKLEDVKIIPFFRCVIVTNNDCSKILYRDMDPEVVIFEDDYKLYESCDVEQFFYEEFNSQRSLVERFDVWAKANIEDYKTPEGYDVQLA